MTQHMTVMVAVVMVFLNVEWAKIQVKCKQHKHWALCPVSIWICNHPRAGLIPCWMTVIIHFQA